jgi:hypothetical protein
MRAASFIVASVCTFALACTAGNTWNTSSGGIQEQPFPATNGPRTADPSAGVTTGNLPASATTTPGFAGNAAGICDELGGVASRCGEPLKAKDLDQCKALTGRCADCAAYYRCAISGVTCKDGKVESKPAETSCKAQFDACFKCVGVDTTGISDDDDAPSQGSGGGSSSSNSADAGR